VSGYSEDLRERIIKAWQTGRKQAWLVDTFGVSMATVRRYIARYKATGSVAATVQKRMQPRINSAHHAALGALVAHLPEAQLPEYCALWMQETGIVVSSKTMSRMLVRLGLRQKKDRRRHRTR